MQLSQARIEAWALATIERKGCDEAGAARVREALTQSLNTIYKAVAFDIDGTLTLPGSTELDPDVCLLIAKLLRRGCHVWLVTGRGTTGARQLASKIVDIGDLEPDEARRLRCVSHNGGLVQETDPTRPHELFRSSRPLLEPFDVAPFDRLNDLRSRFLGVVGENRPALLTNEPTSSTYEYAFGLRAIFNDQDARAAARMALEPILVDYPTMQILVGEYGTVFPLDVTNADKAAGLARLAQYFGIEPSAVLRVGDQGSAGGSDESLLADRSGYSVKDVSTSSSGCFPVVDADGAILTGAAATRHLLETLSIAAPLRMGVPAGSYREGLLPRLREFERSAMTRSNNETRMIERQLSVRVAQLIAHDPGEGDLAITVDGIFDRRSGGVLIHEWDLTDLSDYPAAQALFQLDALDRDTVDADGPDRSMYTDSGILLRGPDYYWNLTNRRGPEHVTDYLQTSLGFVHDALAAMAELRTANPTLTLVQIALAIMDNVRNITLQLLNVALFNVQPPFDELNDAVTPTDTALVSTLGEIAQLLTKAHVDLLLEPHTPWALALGSCSERIKELSEWIEENATAMAERACARSALPTWEFGDKADTFRWREADDLVQNISAVVMGLRAVSNRPAADAPSGPILAVGLQYGGLELPLLASALATRFGLDIKPAAMRVSMYGNEVQGEEARARLDDWIAATSHSDFPVIGLYSPHEHDTCDANCVTSPGHLRPEETHRDVMLFDDNCTTGTTVQAARDLLVLRGCDVRAVVVVRFPGANRAAHMALPNHGHLDIDLAHNFVHGLVGPSPYSRLVVASPHKKGYEDENGVFDKAKLRVKLLLHKNAPQRFPMPQVKPWGITEDDLRPIKSRSLLRRSRRRKDSSGTTTRAGRTSRPNRGRTC